jgi:hypothetical protein
MRLLSLIAIKDQNTALAGMIKKANETENAFEALIEAIRASIRSMLDKVAAEVNQLQALTTTGANTPIEQQRAIVREKLNLAMPDLSALQNRIAMSNASIGGASNMSPNINIQINPAVAGLIDVIQNQSASGISPTVNRINSSYIA